MALTSLVSIITSSATWVENKSRAQDRQVSATIFANLDNLGVIQSMGELNTLDFAIDFLNCAVGLRNEQECT